MAVYISAKKPHILCNNPFGKSIPLWGDRVYYVAQVSEVVFTFLKEFFASLIQIKADLSVIETITS